MSNPFAPPMRVIRKAGLFAAMTVSLVLMGAAAAAEPLRLTDTSFMDVDAQLKGAAGHPNEQWRWNGLKAYLSGHYGEAIEGFKRAAGYADKHSQHYLSLIYWYGQGVPKDAVQAYIWSDLAAERGTSRLLVIREKMWEQLSAEERRQVTARGADFYAKYGDDVAKPKADVEIRRFATNMTGSRLGFNNKPIAITYGGPINGSFGNATTGMLASSVAAKGGSDDQHMYSAQRTQLDAYWKQQDRELESRKGTVEVGTLRNEPSKP